MTLKKLEEKDILIQHLKRGDVDMKIQIEENKIINNKILEIDDDQLFLLDSKHYKADHLKSSKYLYRSTLFILSDSRDTYFATSGYLSSKIEGNYEERVVGIINYPSNVFCYRCNQLKKGDKKNNIEAGFKFIFIREKSTDTSFSNEKRISDDLEHQPCLDFGFNLKSTSCNAVYKYIYTPVVLQKIKRYVNPSEGVTSTDEKDANLTEAVSDHITREEDMVFVNESISNEASANLESDEVLEFPSLAVINNVIMKENQSPEEISFSLTEAVSDHITREEDMVFVNESISNEASANLESDEVLEFPSLAVIYLSESEEDQGRKFFDPTELSVNVAKELRSFTSTIVNCDCSALKSAVSKMIASWGIIKNGNSFYQKNSDEIILGKRGAFSLHEIIQKAEEVVDLGRNIETSYNERRECLRKVEEYFCCLQDNLSEKIYSKIGLEKEWELKEKISENDSMLGSIAKAYGIKDIELMEDPCKELAQTYLNEDKKDLAKNYLICHYFADNFLDQGVDREKYWQLVEEDSEYMANGALKHLYELIKSLEEENIELAEELNNLKEHGYKVEAIVVDGGYELNNLVSLESLISSTFDNSEEGIEDFKDNYKIFKELYRDNEFKIYNLPDFSIRIIDYQGNVKEYKYQKDREVFDGKDEEFDEILSDLNQKIYSFRSKAAEKHKSFLDYYEQNINLYLCLKSISEDLNKNWIRDENQEEMVNNDTTEEIHVAEENQAILKIEDSDSYIKKIEKCLQLKGSVFCNNYKNWFVADEDLDAFYQAIDEVDSLEQVVRSLQEHLTEEKQKLISHHYEQKDPVAKPQDFLVADDSDSFSTCESESNIIGEAYYLSSG